jgi:aspartyl protease family protein
MNKEPGSNNLPPAPNRLGKGMTYAAWLLALGLLTFGFNNWLDAQRNPNRSVRSAVVDGGTQIVLERNRYGHYNLSGSINGQPVEFMLDTGATLVAVPARLADRLGLARGAPTQVKTANGTAVAYATRLASVRLGDIELREVRAHISPGMDGDEVLLGMSVLKKLEFSQRGNSLTLRQPGAER